MLDARSQVSTLSLLLERKLTEKPGEEAGMSHFITSGVEDSVRTHI